MGRRIERRLAYAQQVAQQYAPQIAQLLGYSNIMPTGFSVGKVQPGAAAQASYRGGITFDREFLKTTSKADLRGNVIHELAHVQDPNSGSGKDNVEYRADLARYALNRGDPAWQASQGVLDMAERRGIEMGQPNGPRQGKNGGHKRNAGTNKRSKNGGAYAVLSPSQSQAYTAQLAALQSNYTNALASIKAQGGTIRAQAQSARADIKTQKIAGISETEGAAIERGILGSSADLGGRAAVIAEAAGQAVDVRTERNAAIAQLRAAQMQAQTDYQMGIAGVQADRAAAQQELANQRFQQDMLAQQTSTYQKYLKKLLARGKNPAGADPRVAAAQGASGAAGAAPVTAAPFGDYSGKILSGSSLYGVAPMRAPYYAPAYNPGSSVYGR